MFSRMQPLNISLPNGSCAAKNSASNQTAATGVFSQTEPFVLNRINQKTLFPATQEPPHMSHHHRQLSLNSQLEQQYQAVQQDYEGMKDHIMRELEPQIMRLIEAQQMHSTL